MNRLRKLCMVSKKEKGPNGANEECAKQEQPTTAEQYPDLTSWTISSSHDTASPAPQESPPLDATSSQSMGESHTTGMSRGPSEDASTNRAAAGEAESSNVIAVSPHCPFTMPREHWSLESFDVRLKVYDGTISKVYRAIHRRSKVTVAIKLYKRALLNDMERHQIAREIWLHIQLNQPSIIALYGAWKDARHIYMVLEWAPQGNVLSFAEAHGRILDERTAVSLILEPTLQAIKYIHDLGLIHRDIKPENLLMSSTSQIKLADFGLSIHSKYEVANTRLGTIDYLAPEILNCPVKAKPNDFKINPQQYYNNKVDCWSLGVLAFELLTGYTPFEAPTAPETLRKIRTHDVQYPDTLSAGARDFIASNMVRNPDQRPSIAQLLEHPWVRENSKAIPHMRHRTQTQGDVGLEVTGNVEDISTAASTAKRHVSSIDVHERSPEQDKPAPS